MSISNKNTTFTSSSKENNMKKQTRKSIQASERKRQKEQGFFDGRFAPKVEPVKKNKSNRKHKKDWRDEQ